MVCCNLSKKREEIGHNVLVHQANEEKQGEQKKTSSSETDQGFVL